MKVCLPSEQLDESKFSGAMCSASNSCSRPVAGGTPLAGKPGAARAVIVFGRLAVVACQLLQLLSSLLQHLAGIRCQGQNTAHRRNDTKG